MKDDGYELLDPTGQIPVEDLEHVLEGMKNDYGRSVREFTLEYSYKGHPLLKLCHDLLGIFNGGYSDDEIFVSDSILDMAEQMTYSVPYKDVCREYREFYLLSAFGLSTARLRKICYTARKKAASVNEVREVLDILYKAEVVSGCNPSVIYSRTLGFSKKISSFFCVFMPKKHDDTYVISTPEPKLRINKAAVQFSEPPTLLEFSSIASPNGGSPAVIRKAALHWPSMGIRSWANLSYLIDVIGPFRLVPIEIGSSYTDQDWSQKLVPFKEFIDRYILGIGGCITKKGYLAQFNIFSQATQLLDDIVIPEYCYALPGNSAAGSVSIIVNAWIGPEGTVSPLHNDPYHNIFVQILGYKYIRLYSDSHKDKLYTYKGSDFFSNTSEVDFEAIDYRKFPLLRDVPYVECILGPGDMLYIPKYWWHFVKSLSVSISVSFWFSQVENSTRTSP